MTLNKRLTRLKLEGYSAPDYQEFKGKVVQVNDIDGCNYQEAIVELDDGGLTTVVVPEEEAMDPGPRDDPATQERITASSRKLRGRNASTRPKVSRVTRNGSSSPTWVLYEFDLEVPVADPMLSVWKKKINGYLVWGEDADGASLELRINNVVEAIALARPAATTEVSQCDIPLNMFDRIKWTVDALNGATGLIKCYFRVV